MVHAHARIMSRVFPRAHAHIRKNGFTRLCLALMSGHDVIRYAVTPGVGVRSDDTHAGAWVRVGWMGTRLVPDGPRVGSASGSPRGCKQGAARRGTDITTVLASAGTDISVSIAT